MTNIKHVGRMISNKRKIVVAYRVVPGEPENCIVITTENLSADEHDSLMKAVESSAGQEANDFATVMARTRLPDGRNMLAAFNTTGKMVKVSTSNVEMVPNRNTGIPLNQLNELIAEQQGVTVADLAIKPTSQATRVEEAASVNEIPSTPETVQSTSDVLTDEQLAAQYRSQADSLFKEAKRLREQAEELVPTKKKTKKTEESA